MIPKYFATLVLSVILVTFGATSLRFATLSQVIPGGAQRDDKGGYVLPKVATHRDAFRPSWAQVIFALAAGLPFGVVLHTIFWVFFLERERRSRVARFPPQGSGLPRTFYPNPIAEWDLSTRVFGAGALVASIFAAIAVYDGFMDSLDLWTIYILMALAAAIALSIGHNTHRSLVTARVDTDSISYARGRGDLQWTKTAWSDISHLRPCSRNWRGYRWFWMELEFKDRREKLRIGQSIEGYFDLHDILTSRFTAKKQS